MLLTSPGETSDSLPQLCYGDTSPPQIFLSDVSPQDASWDVYKALADYRATIYADSAHSAYAPRMRECSNFLSFALGTDPEGVRKLKLSDARFCRVRHCPVCQVRRSLMLKAKFHKLFPQIVQDYPTYRWIFLTLTVRNMPVVELREAVAEMNKAFQRLIKLKVFPAKGWLKVLEITEDENGFAHPHFHCLLVVPSRYFNGQSYLSQERWVELWQQCLRVNYRPNVDVRAVKPSYTPQELIPEIFKVASYSSKSKVVEFTPPFLIELTTQTKKMRAISTGGLLKEYLKELENEPEDLIGKDDDDDLMANFLLIFGWKYHRKKYQLLQQA